MSKDRYFTIDTPSEGFYKEKGSKFLSFALPISSQDEVKTHLSNFRKQYYDARHVCYAYALGFPETAYMCSDDGEPAHSAGDPILGQIKSKTLTNVLIVVVRYFGGTKLGVGGLINAYKTAAEEVLNNTKVVEKFDSIPIEIKYSYPQTNTVMKFIHDHELTIIFQDFQADCLLQVEVNKSTIERVISSLDELQLNYKVH